MLLAASGTKQATVLPSACSKPRPKCVGEWRELAWMDGVGYAVVSVVLTLTVHENPWGIAAAWVDPASLG